MIALAERLPRLPRLGRRLRALRLMPVLDLLYSLVARNRNRNRLGRLVPDRPAPRRYP